MGGREDKTNENVPDTKLVLHNQTDLHIGEFRKKRKRKARKLKKKKNCKDNGYMYSRWLVEWV